MKYGLFTYEQSHNNLINIGDYVQSLAARQFLPQVDLYVERDRLASYTGDPIKLIMNGWFAHSSKNWPPNPLIDPLIVSFHLNKGVANEMMASKEIIAYFKNHEPIGCRDYDTLNRIKEAGIDSYYSGCLTTTLNYNGRLLGKDPERGSKIILADVLFKDDVRLRIKRNRLYIIRDLFIGKLFSLNKVKRYIDNLIPARLKQHVAHLTCYYPENTSEDQRFDHAIYILKELASAKLVITSRIHIALPCLALNTPVLFVFGGQLTDLQEFRRLDGVINLMNVLVEDDFDTTVPHLKGIQFFKRSEIDWDKPPQNPRQHITLRNELIRKCEAFVG